MAQYGHHQDNHFGPGKDSMHPSLGGEVYGASHAHQGMRPEHHADINMPSSIADTNHILNNNDSQLMNTFFNDPNNFSLNFNGGMNPPGQNRDFTDVFGYQSFQTSAPRPQDLSRPLAFVPQNNNNNHPSNANTGSNSNTNPGATGQNEGDDMSAASQLVNMAHASPARSHNGQPPTWTHLDSTGITHPNVVAPGALNDSTRRASNSFYAPSMQAFNEFASQQQVQARNNVQTARSAGLVEPRHEPLRQQPSQHVEVTHSYRPIEPGEAVAFFTALPHHKPNNNKGPGRTPVLFSFGSDNSFSMAGYRGPLHGLETREKAGNLLGAPLVERVASREGAPDRALDSQFPPRTSERSHLNHMTFPAPNSPNSSPGHHTYGQDGVAQHNVQPSGSALKRRNTDIEFTHTANFSDPLASYHPRKRHHSVAQYPSADHTMDGASMSRVSHLPTIVDDGDDTMATGKFARPGLKRTRTDPQESGSPHSPGSDGAASPQTGGTSKKKARENKSRPNLTESQKRENHIISEQKRRNVIKQAFNDLNNLIPTLQGGKSGLSKAEVLKEVVGYLTSLVEGNKRMDSFLNGLDGASGLNDRHVPAF